MSEGVSLPRPPSMDGGPRRWSLARARPPGLLQTGCLLLAHLGKLATAHSLRLEGPACGQERRGRGGRQAEAEFG